MARMQLVRLVTIITLLAMKNTKLPKVGHDELHDFVSVALFTVTEAFMVVSMLPEVEGILLIIYTANISRITHFKKTNV